MKYYKLSKTNSAWKDLHHDLKSYAAIYDPLIVISEPHTLDMYRWEELSNVEILTLVLGKKLPVFICHNGRWEEQP